MVNITGEKLHVNQIQDAIRSAETATTVEIAQYRLIPDTESCRYDLLVELDGQCTDDDFLPFLAEFDRSLSQLNIEYASKRASGRLGPPQLYLMRGGWAERQCRLDFGAGKREHQYKWPAIRFEWDEESRSEVTAKCDLGPMQHQR